MFESVFTLVTIFKDDDIFGYGVNISSRLESMSPPGGIFVSKNVFDELTSIKGFDGISLGLQSIKVSIMGNIIKQTF